MPFALLLLGGTTAALIAILSRVDMSVDADTWPAYIALPTALLVWRIWNHASPSGRKDKDSDD